MKNRAILSGTTVLGAGIWVTILTLLGYFLGANQPLIHQYLQEITLITLAVIGVIIGVYIWRGKRG